MNWTIYGRELLILLGCFALLVTVPITINPVSFVSDFPPEIQEAYYKSQHAEKKKETLQKAMLAKKAAALLAALFLFAWMAHLAGARTFWQGTLLAFSYVAAIGAFDTFVLDWIFFARVKRWRLPGTGQMDKEYRQKWFHLKGALQAAPLGAVFAVVTGAVMRWLF